MHAYTGFKTVNEYKLVLEYLEQNHAQILCDKTVKIEIPGEDVIEARHLIEVLEIVKTRYIAQ